MADFSETSVSRNAKRIFSAPIADVDTFNTVVSAFAEDATMNIVKNQTSATYKARIDYKKADGSEAGYTLFYATSNTQMAEVVSHLTGNETTETIAGVGGTSAVNDDEYHWLVKFSCTKNITLDGKNYEDTFTVSIGREYMLISGFTYDTTLETIETWADAQDALA